MKWFTGGLLLSLFFVFAIYRVLVADDVNLSGTAPTEDTEGAQLNDLASIRIYHGTEGTGGPYPNLIVELTDVEPGAQFGYLHADQPDGMHCYVSTAVDLNGNESVFSNEACKLVDTIAPNAPTGFSAQ